MRKASAASINRAEKSRSSAFAWPTSRGNIQAIPYSAISPRRANAVLNRAASDAKRKSQYKAITSPNPTAGPLIAAITGLLSAGKYEYFFRKSARALPPSPEPEPVPEPVEDPEPAP